MYPDDQEGIILPKFQGWRPLNWETESPENGDKWVWLLDSPPPIGSNKGANSPLSKENIGLSFNMVGTCLEIWGKSGDWALYRPSEWVELFSGVIRPFDVITFKGTHPDKSRERINFDIVDNPGYMHCEPNGYGNGLYEVDKIAGHFPLSYQSRLWRSTASAFAMTRLKRPMNPVCSRALPLP